VTNSESASGPGNNPEPEEAENKIRITDKRRIDPDTGEARQRAEAADAVEEAEEIVDDAAAVIAADERVIELTADLQRVTAEYANHRKRVERDREATNELAIVAVLSQLLPILDDIDLARQNDDLQGAFKSVAESLEALVVRLGLERFGEPGDAFDPAMHEALTHSESESAGDEPTGPVCEQIYQPGYRVKDRIVRPARVAVAE
jgi:molecular chaperone GrpE